ncbi:MAG: T9SS type A sorting domain-containing protein [Melioribacteraceae bacterium]|nr:T9SS type A sorting domain-containing protein [Melioribacteraceae bacterium]
MKNVLSLLLICIISTNLVSAQEIRMNMVDEGQYSVEKTYKIDARPLLEKGMKEASEFLKANPDYFSSLKKKAAWNFTVGTQREWWTSNFVTDKFEKVPSTCRAVGTNCYIFVEDDIWNTKVNQANVNKIVESFDSSTPANNSKGIYQTVTEAFGTPPDVDGDPKIIIFVLDIRDGYNGSGGYVAGYFHSLNEVVHTNSNRAEIYYLDADPANLSTDAGLNDVMSTTSHEFQHMVHYRYHNAGLNSEQLTFVNEGCSLTSEVLCGYPIYNQSLFNNETNHYLFDWRDGDENLKDYSRAARYMTYMYEQFGVEFLTKLTQSSSKGYHGINSALSNLTTPTSLRFKETVENWQMANIVNDKNKNSAWGYTVGGVSSVNGDVFVNANISETAVTVEQAAAYYMSFQLGEDLKITFDDDGDNKLIFKAIKEKSDGSLDIEDVTAGTEYAVSGYGTTYPIVHFAVINNDAFYTHDFSFTSTGGSSSTELAYDLNKPTGVLPLTANDTICVVFDGITGGNIDSIRVALRQAGSVYGGIYKYSGATRPSPLGQKIKDLTVTSNIAVRPVYDTEAESYDIPFPNWITVDLTSDNIASSEPFVVAFIVEGTYPENNRVMITTQSDANVHSYTYLNDPYPSSGLPDWYYISLSNTEVYAYLIRAYVGFGVTGVNDEVSELLPGSFELKQNYPNPFNPTTQIDYSIADNGFVKLKIFDVLGNDVAELVNEIKNSGNYSVNFNAKNLSSGTYFYSLQVNGKTITKKLMLLK